MTGLITANRRRGCSAVLAANLHWGCSAVPTGNTRRPASLQRAAKLNMDWDRICSHKGTACLDIDVAALRAHSPSMAGTQRRMLSGWRNGLDMTRRKINNKRQWWVRGHVDTREDERHDSRPGREEGKGPGSPRFPRSRPQFPGKRVSAPAAAT